MNLLLVFLMLAPGSRLNTTFYTFHKLGTYSITDLYVNYNVRRYDFRLTLERRYSDFGPKSFGIEIDSLFRNWRLIIGEKPYRVYAPLSTTLDIWGLTLISPYVDVFLGKTKDYTSLLPPTFRDNKYTFGIKLRRNLYYRIPVEFSFLRKHDNRAQGRILSNNSFGTNAEMKLGPNWSLGSQIWTSLSDIGFGSSVLLNSSYTGQKYGGHAYFRKILSNYVAASNLETEPGNWFRLNLYQKPNDWIRFGQDISYSSFYDAGFGLNTALARAPLPAFGYGLNYSRRTEFISQYIHSSWRYKRFTIAGDYSWSREQQVYGVRLGQEIKKFQFWSNVRFNDDVLWQIGGIFPITPGLRMKNYLNIAWQNSQTRRTTGAELSFKLIKNFNLNCTYEEVHHNSTDDHFVSLSLSNTLLFDEVGFSFVSGRVFMDLNNNGFYDVEDVVVPDVEVTLDGQKSARTSKNGTYSFSFVKAGEHNVGLNLGSIPAEIGTKERQVAVNTKFFSKARVNFSLEELGIIEGIIYYDDNKNNTMDDDEVGVSGVVLALNGYLTTSNEDGRFRFANLAPGTYGLEVKILPPGTILSMPMSSYINIKPGTKFSNCYLGIIKKGRPVKKKIFGDVESATLAVTYAAQAQEFTRAGDYAAAMKWWQKVIELDPANAEATAALANLKERLDVSKKQQKILRERIEELFRRGTTFFIAEMYDRALEAFDEILALDPNHKSAQTYKKRTEVRIKAIRGE